MPCTASQLGTWINASGSPYNSLAYCERFPRPHNGSYLMPHNGSYLMTNDTSATFLAQVWARTHAQAPRVPACVHIHISRVPGLGAAHMFAAGLKRAYACSSCLRQGSILSDKNSDVSLIPIICQIRMSGRGYDIAQTCEGSMCIAHVSIKV
jgi:hypothetical protein